MAIGVVGLGRWGTRLAATLGERERVVGVRPRSGLRPEHAGPHLDGIELVPSYDTLLRDPSVRAVCIATRPDEHFELACRALDSGRPAFVEKPMTCDVGQAEALVGRVRATGLPLVVGHVLLFTDAYVRLATQLVADPPRRVDVEWRAPGHRDLFWELLPHHVAVLIGWLGQATGHDLRVTGSPGDRLEVRQTVAGCLCRVRLAWAADRHRSVDVVAASGRRWRWWGDDLDELVDGRPVPVARQREEPLAVEVDHFLDLLDRPRLAGVSDVTLGARVVAGVAGMRSHLVR